MCQGLEWTGCCRNSTRRGLPEAFDDCYLCSLDGYLGDVDVIQGATLATLQCAKQSR